MRFISTRVHGVLDYLMGMILIASPWILGFADNTAAMWVPVILGASTIIYSLFTDYELGAMRGLSMPAHLWLDALSGIFLAASPWIFGFSDRVSTPHVVLGLVEVLAALTTVTMPSAVRVRRRDVTSTRTVRDTSLGTRATPGLRSDISSAPNTGTVIPDDDRELGRGTAGSSGNLNRKDRENLDRGTGAVL